MILWFKIFSINLHRGPSFFSPNRPTCTVDAGGVWWPQISSERDGGKGGGKEGRRMVEETIPGVFLSDALQRGHGGGGSETRRALKQGRGDGDGNAWKAWLITCSTVSPGCMSVKTSTLYDTSPNVGVLSLASTTRMLTVTGPLCWTPSDANICERGNRMDVVWGFRRMWKYANICSESLCFRDSTFTLSEKPSMTATFIFWAPSAGLPWRWWCKWQLPNARPFLL